MFFDQVSATRGYSRVLEQVTATRAILPRGFAFWQLGKRTSSASNEIIRPGALGNSTAKLFLGFINISITALVYAWCTVVARDWRLGTVVRRKRWLGAVVIDLANARVSGGS